MGTAILLFLTMIFSSLHFAKSTDKLVSMECQPAVGVVGQDTKIFCSFKPSGQYSDIVILAASVIKKGEKDPVFQFTDSLSRADGRVQLPSKTALSLLFTKTTVSDEGLYFYTALTNRGIIKDGEFKISVTAKYDKPIMNSWPEEVEDGGHADLYCNASGGYPAGAIHWFDRLNTNWTSSSTLETTEGENKVFRLSSKLTFTRIDSIWAPFRCVVLNSKFVPEEENTFQLVLKDGKFSPNAFSNGITKTEGAKIVAPVVVIGSLLIGLLIAVLLRGRCRRPDPRRFANVEEALTKENEEPIEMRFFRT